MEGGELLDAPLTQLEDESDQSGYVLAAAPTPNVQPTPLGDITLWYHHGPQGETRYLTDETGTVTDTYLYDAYGNPISSSGTYYNPHRYGGKFGYHSNLNSAGFVLAGQRWYSPKLRRWGSRDPRGYTGGSNLFGYAKFRPTRYFDATGGSPESYLPHPRRRPPGWNSGWPTGIDKRGPYSEDPSSKIRYYPHGEDERHYDHYDFTGPDGGTKRFPQKCLKPWPTQVKPPYGDQNDRNPWPDDEDRSEPELPFPGPLFVPGPSTLGPTIPFILKIPYECAHRKCI